jgi:hypothetical protein
MAGYTYLFCQDFRNAILQRSVLKFLERSVMSIPPFIPFLATAKTDMRTCHPLPFLQNGSLLTHVECVVSLLMLQHKRPFGRGTENGAPSSVRIFKSQFSLVNFMNRRRSRQEVLRKYSSTGKRILLKKCRNLGSQGQGWPPGAWSIPTGQEALPHAVALPHSLPSVLQASWLTVCGIWR